MREYKTIVYAFHQNELFLTLHISIYIDKERKNDLEIVVTHLGRNIEVEFRRRMAPLTQTQYVQSEEDPLSTEEY